MKTLKILIVITFPLLIIFASCNKDPQIVPFTPQEVKLSVIAAEEMGVTVYVYPGTSSMLTILQKLDKVDSNFYMVADPGGGYFPLQLKFKLQHNLTMKNVQWKIGTKTYYGDSTYIDFSSPVGIVDVLAIVTYKKFVDPYNFIEQKDTIIKKINLSVQTTWDYTYRGIDKDNPLDTFNINLNYTTDPNWTGNTTEVFFNISGIPKGYAFKIGNVVSGNGFVFQSPEGYPPTYYFLNNTYVRPPFGTGFFKNNFDSVEIRYCLETTPQYGYWGDGSKVYNKVFIGKRVF